MTGDAPLAPHRIRETLLGEVEGARRGLSQPDPSDESVHEVRKQLKRARGTLRLLRTAVGTVRYRHYNALMRDAARPLTPVRDAKVLQQTLRSLANGKGGAFISDLRRALRLEQARARGQLTHAELAHLVATLTGLCRELEHLPEAGLDSAALRKGLERAYRSARKAYRCAVRRGSDENLHEWRKQTKYYAHQLELMHSLDPRRFAKNHKRATRLADHLGDDHDLAVLNEQILRHARAEHAASRDASVEELLQELARRRKRLQRKSLRLGEQLYVDKPRRVGRKAERSLELSHAPVS